VKGRLGVRVLERRDHVTLPEGDNDEAPRFPQPRTHHLRTAPADDGRGSASGLAV
jgi:hypothetical protein